MNASIEPQALFSRLIPGTPGSILGLDIVPLFLPEQARAADAQLLEEGIGAGDTVVSEVNEGGVVGQVRVLHRGRLPLLVLQGEQIFGAKQNRSFNSSFVIAPGSEVVLPVSCVEQGRWQRKSTAFAAGATTLAPSLRANKLKRVSESITRGGSYDANQQEVWAGVRQYMHETGSHSPTASFEDVRRKRALEIEAVLEKLAPLPQQVGIAVVREGRVVMMDIFGSPSLFARAFKKCLRGALSDASSPSDAAASPEQAALAVKQALDALAGAAPTRARSPAEGDTWTANARSVTYTAAVWDGAVYHCAAAS